MEGAYAQRCKISVAIHSKVIVMRTPTPTKPSTARRLGSWIQPRERSAAATTQNAVSAFPRRRAWPACRTSPPPSAPPRPYP